MGQIKAKLGGAAGKSRQKPKAPAKKHPMMAPKKKLGGYGTKY